MKLLAFVSGVLKETVSMCNEGQSVREMCAKADTRMEEDTGKAFKKDKKVQKGKTYMQIICGIGLFAN